MATTDVDNKNQGGSPWSEPPPAPPAAGSDHAGGTEPPSPIPAATDQVPDDTPADTPDGTPDEPVTATDALEAYRVDLPPLPDLSDLPPVGAPASTADAADVLRRPEGTGQSALSRLGDRLSSPFFRYRRQTMVLLSLVVLLVLVYVALGQLNLGVTGAEPSVG